jgi:aminoglycoside phosphotransferase (APT) family kinase protein
MYWCDAHARVTVYGMKLGGSLSRETGVAHYRVDRKRASGSLTALSCARATRASAVWMIHARKYLDARVNALQSMDTTRSPVRGAVARPTVRCPSPIACPSS